MSKNLFSGPTIYVPHNTNINLFEKLNSEKQISSYNKNLFFNLLSCSPNPSYEFFAIIDADSDFHYKVGSKIEAENTLIQHRFIYEHTSSDYIKAFKAQENVKPYIEALKNADIDYELAFIVTNFYRG